MLACKRVSLEGLAAKRQVKIYLEQVPRLYPEPKAREYERQFPCFLFLR